MAMLGWNPGTEKEIFTREELIEEFSLDRIHKGGAIFDEKKLRWINREHLKRLSQEDRVNLISQKIINHNRSYEHSWVHIESRVLEAENLIFDRVETLGDVEKMVSAQELDYVFEPPHYPTSLLLWKGTTDYHETMMNMINVRATLLTFGENSKPNKEAVKNKIMPYADQQGRGKVLWPLRVALTGLEKSPDPFSVIEAFGIKESIRRIDFALTRFKRAHDGEEIPVYPS
jgi:glutamyl/glutaminyl-tRNA synthetase